MSVFTSRKAPYVYCCEADLVPKPRHEQTTVDFSSIDELSKKIGLERAIAEFPRLTRLELSSDNEIDDEGLKQIANELKKSCPNFAEFVFTRESGTEENKSPNSIVAYTRRGTHLTFEGIIDAFKHAHLTHLEIQNLAENGQFEFNGVIDLPQLRTLVLQSYRKDPFWKRLPIFTLGSLKGTPRLEALTLRHFLFDIGKADFRYFSIYNDNPLSNLKTLEIDGEISEGDGFKHMSALETCEATVRNDLPSFMKTLSTAPLPALKGLVVQADGWNDCRFSDRIPNNNLLTFYKIPRPGLTIEIVYLDNYLIAKDLQKELTKVQAECNAKIVLRGRLWPQRFYHPETGNFIRDKYHHERTYNFGDREE